jgi:hypothetical protein
MYADGRLGMTFKEIKKDVAQLSLKLPLEKSRYIVYNQSRR